jgi:hypothetical protein
VQGGAAASSTAGILPKGASDSTHSSLELLLLTVNLSWPISLVVSKRQLLHYQVRRSCDSISEDRICGGEAERQPAGHTASMHTHSGAVACKQAHYLLPAKKPSCFTHLAHAQTLHRPGPHWHVMLCHCISTLQVIFKQLLSLKWAERDLAQAWQSMRATKRLSGCVQCCTPHINKQLLQHTYHATLRLLNSHLLRGLPVQMTLKL